MKRWHWILLALLNAATIGLFYFGSEHPYPKSWDKIPIFYAMLGFFGCLLLIVVSKALGNSVLLRKEDYYDGDA